MNILLLVLVVILLFGGGIGYQAGWPAHYYGPSGGLGFVLLIVLIVLLLR